MTASNLLRWAGLAALLGGALIIISALISLILDPDVTSGAYVFGQLLDLLGTPLVLLGLVGLYASQARAAGTLGLLGFLAAFVGTTLVEGIFWANASLVPTIAAKAPDIFEGSPNVGPPLTFLSVSVGWVLFGVATLKAGVYPRTASILLIVGAGLSIVRILGGTGVAGAAAQLGFLVLQTTVIWLGLLLFTERGALQRNESPRVS